MKYVFVLSDPAEADRDRLYLFYSRHDSEFGKRWEAELQIALEALTSFPGPLSHARDEEASAYYAREVRRMLYYGPTKRRTAIPVRVLYTVLPPDPLEPLETTESVIFLLRFLHGAQAFISHDNS